MEVTGQKLGDALEAIGAVTVLGDARNEDGSIYGCLRYPQDVAVMVLNALPDDTPGYTVTPAADAELAAMAALLPALPLVSGLSLDARKRVMNWAKHRACDGLPPF
jgi:hypothetical protein